MIAEEARLLELRHQPVPRAYYRLADSRVVRHAAVRQFVRCEKWMKSDKLNEKAQRLLAHAAFSAWLDLNCGKMDAATTKPGRCDNSPRRDTDRS